MSQTQDLFVYRPSYLGQRGYKRTASGGGPTSSAKRGASTSSARTKKSMQQLVGKKNIKATFSKLVREVAEKKTTNTDPLIYAFNANNSSCSPAVDLMAISLDAIGQGVSNGQRIGNDIYVHDMTIRIAMTMLPGAIATVRPGYVQIWIGTLKDSPASLPNATDLGRLYDDGGGASGPDGTVLATLRNLNKDYFNFKHYSIHKLGSAGTLYPNNDYPISLRINIPGIVKGRVRYNDTTAATNKYCFMWMAFTSSDNTPILAQVPVDCQYYVSCKYSDI